MILQMMATGRTESGHKDQLGKAACAFSVAVATMPGPVEKSLPDCVN
jgi:hypothetical protein